MIIAIIIGVLFYRNAVRMQLNKVLWPIIGIVSYLTAQFLAGIVIGLTAPQMLDQDGSILIIGILSGITGVAIAYWIMAHNGKKAQEKDHSNPDLIDDNF